MMPCFVSFRFTRMSMKTHEPTHQSAAARHPATPVRLPSRLWTHQARPRNHLSLHLSLHLFPRRPASRSPLQSPTVTACFRSAFPGVMSALPPPWLGRGGLRYPLNFRFTSGCYTKLGTFFSLFHVHILFFLRIATTCLHRRLVPTFTLLYEQHNTAYDTV